MNDSLAQHSAQTPSPSTGSRQATHSVGSAISSASRETSFQLWRHAFNAPRRWPEIERDGDALAFMNDKANAKVADTQVAFGGCCTASEMYLQPRARRWREPGR